MSMETDLKESSPVCSESVKGGRDLWSCDSSSPADHLVIMVNGILGSSTDWKFGAEQFVKALPDKVIVHRSERNVSKLTLDGIDVMGERLAEEVVEVIQRKPEVRKISFVAHSMGGLVARYAIGRLYRPVSTDIAAEVSNNASDGDSRGTICGLEPMNFITVATPHLGSRGNNQVPFLFGVTVFEKAATQIIHWIFRRTGRHLFLTDAEKEELPLLRRMVDDCGDLHFMSALRAFHRRATYSNVGYDHIVGWRTSSIRRSSELPKWEDSVSEKYPHVVYEERCKGINDESCLPVSAEKGSFDALEDDVLVFFRGDLQSTEGIKGILLKFCEATGLQMNYNKSNLLSAGISEGDKLALANLLGVERGALPLKYLGLPLVSSSLGIRESLPLIEKVTVKLRDWKARFLSHAGRLLLIQSVLSSFLAYWARAFILPSTILDLLESILAKFLWGGPMLKRNMHHASLDKIKLPKKQGGLNVMNLKLWNKSAYCGLIFKIVAEDESLWSQWFKAQVIKHKHFWSCEVPKDCSWVTRNVFKLRDLAAEYIRYQIKDGTKVKLWHDLWCSTVPLIFCSEARLSLSLHEEAMVSELISVDRWNDSVINLPAGELRDSIMNTDINSYLERDRVVWLPAPNGLYSSKTGYNALRGHRRVVCWWSMVWGKLVKPSDAFTAWQLLGGSLPTKARLIHKGIINDSTCVLCNSANENSFHLFFDCSYTNYLWGKVKALLGLSCSGTLQQQWQALITILKGKESVTEIKKAYVCAWISSIWRERNWRLFRNAKLTKEKVMEKLQKDMRLYLQLQLTILEDSIQLRVLLDRLGVVVELKERQTVHCKWSCPPIGYHKLNCDGSVTADSSGYGGIVRDSEGYTAAIFCGNNGKDSILTQELHAVYIGLRLCADLNIKFLQVESDSRNAVRAVLGLDKPPWYCQNLVNGIVAISREFLNFSLVHIFRESNAAADHMAAIGRNVSLVCLYSLPPLSSELESIVMSDRVGTVYCRA